MNCKWISDHLTEVVDGLLTSAEQELVDAHLASCEECNSLILDLRADALALRELERVEAPTELRLRVAEAISQPQQKKNPWKFFIPKLAPVAAAVLVSVLSLNLVPTYLASRQNSLKQAPEAAGEEFYTLGITAAPPEAQDKSADSEVTYNTFTEGDPGAGEDAATRKNTSLAMMRAADESEEPSKPSKWVVTSAAGSAVFLLWGAYVYRLYKRQ